MRELKGLLLFACLVDDQRKRRELVTVSVGACSLVGLLLELGGAVRESNIEFFGSLHDGLPTERGETSQ